MLLIKCPFCGPRPELEFAYGGQAHIDRPKDPMALDDEAWAAYLYIRSNTRGIHAERWRHINGCARFFNVKRNTMNDEILSTYKTGETPPEETGRASRGGDTR